MCKVVKRGSNPKDEKEFKEEAKQKLYQAGIDIFYLINQGYQIKGASTFVGNHYLLSERQRMALVRGIAQEKRICSRKEKELHNKFVDGVVHIDGFNTIITLEVALSGSFLLKGMDGTIRDLAGLRGTYRMIDKTKQAIQLIGESLTTHKVGKAVFYLDAPVSNSGKLRQRILEELQEVPFEVEVQCMNDVDQRLEKLGHVITSDAIILDQCESWINLNSELIEKKLKITPWLDFTRLYKER